MSNSVKSFFLAMKTDSKTREELKSLKAQNLEFFEDKLDATVKIARKAGFDFTKDDYYNFLKDMYEPKEVKETPEEAVSRIFGGQDMSDLHSWTILYSTCHTYHCGNVAPNSRYKKNWGGH